MSYEINGDFDPSKKPIYYEIGSTVVARFSTIHWTTIQSFMVVYGFMVVRQIRWPLSQGLSPFINIGFINGIKMSFQPLTTVFLVYKQLKYSYTNIKHKSVCLSKLNTKLANRLAWKFVLNSPRSKTVMCPRDLNFFLWNVFNVSTTLFDKKYSYSLLKLWLRRFRFDKG